MFERFLIDLANQWVPTSLGSVIQASVFYGEVLIVTPVGRLLKLIESDQRSLDVLNYLLESGNLKIQIEEFPAGELALSLDLVKAGLRASVFYDYKPEPLYVTMIGAYKALQNDILVGVNIAVSKHGLDASPAATKKLVDHLMLPSVDETYVLSKKQYLQRVLVECSKNLLLEAALDAQGDNHARGVRFTDQEVEGMSFLSLESSNETAAEYLEAISFAGFLLEHGTSDNFHDLFTTDKFNTAMKTIYAKNLERIGLNGGLDAFQNVVVNIDRIADLFDAGELEFTKVVPVIEQKRLLLDTLKDKPNEKNIIEWYYENKNNGPLSGTMAKKAVRYCLFAAPGMALDLMGAGGVGTAFSLGIGAFDCLLLDKLASNRGPTTFVDDYLRPLGAK